MSLRARFTIAAAVVVALVIVGFVIAVDAGYASRLRRDGITEEHISTAVGELTRILIGVGLLGLGLAGALAWLVAGSAIAPVTALITAVESVANDGNLATRVPSGDPRDEIGRLSSAFNSSLARIEVMYQALEAVIIKQRRFVADASHELRTPLTTVSSCLEMIHHYPEMPEPQRTTVLDDALHEAQQMARLVDDLLTLASMDSGERLQRAPFDWSALLEPAVNDARRDAAPRAVKADIANDLGTGVGDVRALQQLITILVGNVTAHTPPGTTITIAAQHATAPAAGVELTISDDGPGVPEAMRESIFERFVRVDPARHGDATGLGLAIARAIVANHGGTISANPVEPHGLRVTAVIAPLQATPDRRRAPRPQRSATKA